MEYIYAALLLHRLGKPINEENLQAVLKAAGATIDEGKVKIIVASLNGVNIDEQLASANIVAAAPSQGSATETPKEEKKEEPKVEAAEGLAALFG